MAYDNDLPEVHFGEANAKPIDWREFEDDDDDDDKPASQDLINMLGFDPDKEQVESNDSSRLSNAIALRDAIVDLKDSVSRLKQ
jgi:hypothetical protein